MAVAEPKLYELDPGGDTKLIVKILSTTQPTESDSNKSTVRENDNPSDVAQLSGDAHHSDEAAIQHSSDAATDAVADAAVDAASSIPEPTYECVACFRVSSRHLILASPFFSELFQSELTRNARVQSPDCIEVPLMGDDPDALLILMRLVHGRFKEVPRRVNLATLTQIAILVDKYELTETTDLLIQGWIMGIKDKIPQQLTKDVLSYLLIAAVFDYEGVLIEASRVALQTSNEVVRNDGLPIPKQIIDKINSHRESFLHEIFAFLEDTQEELLNQQMCPSGNICNSMALGRLMIGMRWFALSPLPKHPYEKCTIDVVLANIEDMDLPNKCEALTRNHPQKINGTCRGLRTRVKAKMEELQDRLEICMG